MKCGLDTVWLYVVVELSKSPYLVLVMPSGVSFEGAPPTPNAGASSVNVDAVAPCICARIVSEVMRTHALTHAHPPTLTNPRTHPRRTLRDGLAEEEEERSLFVHLNRQTQLTVA